MLLYLNTNKLWLWFQTTLSLLNERGLLSPLTQRARFYLPEGGVVGMWEGPEKIFTVTKF